MTGMQDVEAAVREHDALAATFRLADQRDELGHGHQAAAAAALRVQRPLQLRAVRGCGADFADDDAGAEIRETRRVRDIEARSHAGSEQRDHRVARAGDVENLTSLRRQRQGFSVGEQGHPLLAARDEQRVEVELTAQLCALREQVALARATADDGLELAAIRGHARTRRDSA